jgi:hypothetical protein
MPAPITIQASVRTMLIVMVAVADANITHGYRLQDTTLPAITYEVTQEEVQSIGASPLLMASVTIRIIAVTTQGALDLIPYVKAVCLTGTFSGLTFESVQWNGYTVEPAAAGDGDEQMPAEVACEIDIYYRG